MAITLASTIAGATAVAAAPAPIAVSPAAEGGLARVEARCPTFSWTSVSTRQGYELKVYRVTGGELADGSLAVEEPALLATRVPAGANSWTPNVGRCLERGERYAWAIRPLDSGGRSAWSRPSLFEVAPLSADSALAEAVAELRRELGSAEASGGRRATTVGPEAPDRTAGQEGSAGSRTLGGPNFTVDGGGNVTATSYTGNGANLSNVVASAFNANPSNCSAGNSPLGVTASGSAEGCFDVATQTELNTHKSSADHDARYLQLGGGALTGSLSIAGGFSALAVTGGGLQVTGDSTAYVLVDGIVRWKCPKNLALEGQPRFDQVGSWCVDNAMRSAAAGGVSMAACHADAMTLCPLSAIMTCDAANVGSALLNSCGTVTDSGGAQIVRTAGHDGDGAGSAFNELLQYDGSNNEASPVAEATALPYFCCMPISGSPP